MTIQLSMGVVSHGGARRSEVRRLASPSTALGVDSQGGCPYVDLEIKGRLVGRPSIEKR